MPIIKTNNGDLYDIPRSVFEQHKVEESKRDETLAKTEGDEEVTGRHGVQRRTGGGHGYQWYSGD